MNAAAALLVVSTLLATPSERNAGEHLVAGASAFREARYEQALVEFRVAQAMGSSEARPYAAATLVKLGRIDDAIETFDQGEERDDPLLTYYHALACYEARLYLCADRLLGNVGTRSGPRVAEQAAKTRAAIAAELAKEPPKASIDWYMNACAERRSGGRAILAVAFCREAVGLAERRADRYRFTEAASQVAALIGQPGTPR